MAYYQGLSIQGLQEAQRRNLRRISNLEPSGLARHVRDAATQMHRWLTYYTPWDTGALRASRRITFNDSVPRAQIFTSRAAYNPRSSTPPAEYDVYLHERGYKPGLRGGIQASYPYTMEQKGDGVLRNMANKIRMDVRQP